MISSRLVVVYQVQEIVCSAFGAFRDLGIFCVQKFNMLKVLCKESVRGTYICTYMYVSGFHTGEFGGGRGGDFNLRMGSCVNIVDIVKEKYLHFILL